MTHPHSAPQRPPLPRGWKRFVARLPVHLYRIGLGPLFGRRLLLLIHTGRASGLTRKTVVEVVEHDRAGGSWTVASGIGPEAQWYRNLLLTPQATIQVGRRYYPVTAQPVTAEEGGRLMARYAPRHPSAARRLCRFMGYDIDGSEADHRRAGESVPFLRLEAAPGSY
ncbi:nitroreductase family deazaflavin-dependent oxidoreductase [Streptomyces sp. NPDC048389]|uniref:nitroreductase family deazaflavin-dependent oxidoreductase n=1 Tax=Streptomyces sp. NPDC048389 TaxID=3154622 RepID=UPI003452C275